MQNKARPFESLKSALAEYIAKVPPGERLPTEPLLARQLGVSRATLREAMRSFESQGIIRRKQGIGTFVNGHPQVLDAGLEQLDSIETLADRINLEVSLGVCTIRERPADDVEAEALGLPAGAPVVLVSRAIRTADRPIAYLVDILPGGLLQIDELKDFKGSVLDILLKRGDVLSHSRTEIHTVAATSEIARPMEIQRGDSLLLFVAYLFDQSGRVIDYSHSYFLPGYFSFHINRRVGGL
jgi:GntR family transcriptional regulator